MSCPFSLENVKFRETAHIAFEDEYVTAYQSTDIVPKIYKSVNTPRDNNGLSHQASPRPTTAPGTANGSRKRHLLNNIRKSEKNSKL